jgi:hypothetical protein
LIRGCAALPVIHVVEDDVELNAGQRRGYGSRIVAVGGDVSDLAAEIV